MGTVSKTTSGPHTIWVDANEPQRWLDVWGPEVNRVVEEFVEVPFASANNMARFTTTLVNASTAAQTAGALGGNLLITTAGAENDGVNAQVTGEAWKASLVHGLLHLLGYEHGAEMETREQEHVE